MKEQKELEKEQQPQTPEETPKQQNMPEGAAADIDNGDDDVATAEEMEAFIRDRREKEREKKEKQTDDKTDVFSLVYHFHEFLESCVFAFHKQLLYRIKGGKLPPFKRSNDDFIEEQLQAICQ